MATGPALGTGEIVAALHILQHCGVMQIKVTTNVPMSTEQALR